MRQLIVISTAILLSACSASATGSSSGTAPETYIGPDGKQHVDATAVASNQMNEMTQDAQTDITAQTSQGMTDFKNNLYKGATETKDWLLTPPVNKPMKPVPYSYCYTVLQDIMCYRQPMPGWEDRLVAYQGTGAPPPPVSITKPLPHVATADEKQEARMATVQPVFAKMPSDIKDDSEADAAAKSSNVPAQVDSAHETLPDPALAPQL